MLDFYFVDEHDDLDSVELILSTDSNGYPKYNIKYGLNNSTYLPENCGLAWLENISSVDNTAFYIYRKIPRIIITTNSSGSTSIQYTYNGQSYTQTIAANSTWNSGIIEELTSFKVISGASNITAVNLPYYTGTLRRIFHGNDNTTPSNLTTLSFISGDVTSIEYLLENSKVQYVNLEALDLSRCTGMICFLLLNNQVSSVNARGCDFSNFTDFRNAFYSCTNLTRIHATIDTSNAIYLNRIFYNCTKLNYVSGGFERFDFSHTTDTTYMFLNTLFTKLEFPSMGDTSNITTTNGMFLGCNKVTTMYFNNFNLTNVTNSTNMFYNCSALTRINGIISNIKRSISFAQSPLDLQTIIMIVNNLATVTTTQTLSLSTTTKNLMPALMKSYVTHKGWTLA